MALDNPVLFGMQQGMAPAQTALQAMLQGMMTGYATVARLINQLAMLPIETASDMLKAGRSPEIAEWWMLHLQSMLGPALGQAVRGFQQPVRQALGPFFLPVTVPDEVLQEGPQQPRSQSQPEQSKQESPESAKTPSEPAQSQQPSVQGGGGGQQPPTQGSSSQVPIGGEQQPQSQQKDDKTAAFGFSVDSHLVNYAFAPATHYWG